MQKGVLATKDILAFFSKKMPKGVFLVPLFCLLAFQNKGINNENRLLRLLITKAWCVLRLFFKMDLTSFASFCVTIAYFVSTQAEKFNCSEQLRFKKLTLQLIFK